MAEQKRGGSRGKAGAKSTRRPVYASANNKSTKQPPDYIEIEPPRKRRGVHGEVAQSEGVNYSKVYEVDHTKSPMATFKEALIKGKAMVDMGNGTYKEAKFAGVEFNIVDSRSGLRFNKSCSLEEAKQVFLHGKDQEVFKESFAEAWSTHVNNIQESQQREDFGTDYGPYNDINSVGDGLDVQYTPLGNGPLNQQLYLHDQWDMLAKAFEFYHHNPYAHRAIDIIVNFVLGRGYSINFADANLQELWNDNSVALNIFERSYMWAKDLERQGELFLKPDFDPYTGDIDNIHDLEASTIWEVITDPEDVHKIYGYWQQYQSPVQLFADEAGTLAFKYIVNLFTPEEIIHIKVNHSGSEKRGRSTLFPAFEYLKMIYDYHAATANKAIASACVVFDWSIDGSPGDVQTFAQSIPVINLRKPISSVYHSKNTELKLETTSETKGRDTALEAIINAIAVATGVGKEYLGATSISGRANALVGVEPAVKHFEQRQKTFTMMMTQLIQKWIAHKIEAGQISETRLASTNDKVHIAMGHLRKGNFKGALNAVYSIINGSLIPVKLDKTINVKFPEIVKGDLTQMIKNIAFMQSMGWWSPERAAVAATQEFGHIDNYDYYDEQKEIESIGLKPIAAECAQVLMVDEENPLVNQSPGSNALDTPRPGSVTPPKSGNDSFNARRRNNPSGSGASNIRRELGGKNKKTAEESRGILGWLFRR